MSLVFGMQHCIHHIQQAFTHSSVVMDDDVTPRQDYERLEFLGDSILKLVCGVHAYNVCPNLREGDLSRYKDVLIRYYVWAILSFFFLFLLLVHIVLNPSRTYTHYMYLLNLTQHTRSHAHTMQKRDTGRDCLLCSSQPCPAHKDR